MADSTSVTPWAGKLASDSSMIVASIEKDSVRNVGYTQFGDLLRRSTSLTPLSQGSLGQRDGIDILGLLPGEQVVAHNGVPLYSASTGGFHPLLIAPAAAERIEVLAGTDALGTLPMMALAGINVQRKQYNSASPFTSMWYHQGAGDLVAGNVAFAQNVSRVFSIAANVRRMGARGVYQQTDFDSWNVQLQNRYRLNDASAVTLSYDLATIDADVWSGLSSDPYGSADLIENLLPKTISAREITRRHDVSLMHTYQSSADAAFRSSTSAYVSSDVHRQQDSTRRGWYAGVLSSADYVVGPLALHGGINLTDAATHGWTSFRYTVLPHVAIVSSLRYDGGSAGGTGYGAAVQYRDSSFSAKADVSRIQRTDGLGASSLYYAHVSHRLARFDLQAYLYHRSSNVPLQGSSGGIVTIGTVLGAFECLVNVRGIIRDTLSSKLTWYGNVRIAYAYHTGASVVRLGAECGYISSGLLPQYDIVSRSYGTAPPLSSSQQLDGVSVFARINVGTASIRASFENILGTRWYTVAYMPEIPRQFRLSVDWTFVD